LELRERRKEERHHRSSPTTSARTDQDADRIVSPVLDMDMSNKIFNLKKDAISKEILIEDLI
jgi:hypothetical protein